MTNASVDEIYLAAFKNPEKFTGKKFEALLLQNQIELEHEIREKLASNSSIIAQLVILLLEDSWKARFPDSDCSRTYECKLSGRALLFEKVFALVDSQSK